VVDPFGHHWEGDWKAFAVNEKCPWHWNLVIATVGREGDQGTGAKDRHHEVRRFKIRMTL
jgi:hypothetical protein